MNQDEWIEWMQNHECSILSYCNRMGNSTPKENRVKICAIKLLGEIFIASIDTKENQWVGCFNGQISLQNPESIYLQEKNYEKKTKSHSS